MQKFGAIPETGRLDNATVKLMHTKRCGVEDVTRKSDPDSLQLRSLTGHQQNSRRRTKRFIQGAEGWRKRTITYFISNWSPKLSEQVVVSEMQKAFQVWAEYANLKFVRVNSPDADIIVAFGRGPHGDGYAFDGEGLVLAHAFYPYEFGSFGGDIHFDDDEKWKLKLDGPFDDGVDFFSVAVHELGHSLGLAHSPEKDSVMFPYFKGFNNNPARLAYDDVLGMYHVYVSKNLPETDKTEAPDRQSPRPTTTTARPTTTRPTTRRLPGYPSYPTRRPYTTTTTMRTTQRPSFVPTYEGDYDTVTSHRQKFGSSTPIGGRMTVQSTEKTSSSSTTHRTATEVAAHDDDDDHRQRPNKNNHTICDGAVDTIALLRGEIVVIRDSLVWRLSDKGVTLAGYPVPFRRLFWQLPDEVTKIDAIYERPGDNTIVIFSGDKYWETDGNRLSPNSPRSLTFLGLPSFVKKVDAVLVWGKNGKTYFFSDKYYWKMDDSLFMMEQGYPQKITERWRGVPSNIDAALTYRDGMTYFFKGKQYWRFDNAEIQTLQKYPKSSGRDWFGCS
ncbi:Hypothetical predicted protein [Cloeon dipterum]|nr:Hypothetical predicted protein [Cloeon dipterum]